MAGEACSAHGDEPPLWKKKMAAMVKEWRGQTVDMVRCQLHHSRFWYSVMAVVTALWMSILALQAEAQPGFVNIDCGANVENYDAALNMTWSTDDRYTCEGVNAVDEGSNGTSVYNPFRALNTIRRFPAGASNKSCYALPTVSNTSYLVRASFLPISSGPSFDLVLEGTRIKTVETMMGDFVEMLFTATRDTAYVCLLRTSQNDDPYISALELRPLDPSMYPLVRHGNYLSRLQRYNFGADEKISPYLRYPDDPYDRVWLNYLGQASAINTTHTIDTSAAVNNPPTLVMSTAKRVNGQWNSVPWIPNMKYYIVMYFAELDPSMNATSREFDIFLDSTPWLPGFSVVRDAPGGAFAAVQVDKPYVTVSGAANFTFSPCMGAIDDPLLNAYEVYQVFENPQALTYWSDAMAIIDIKKQYNLTEWTGDPCSPYPFDWVTCSVDPAGPRITSLNLSNKNLSGTIAQGISNLTAVTFVRLDNNLLTGPIPDLSQLQSLTRLYLQHNSLTGDIPQSLINLPSLQELDLQDNNLGGNLPDLGNRHFYMNISGNPQLCKGMISCGMRTDQSSAPPTPFRILTAVAGSIGGVLLLVVGLIVFFRRVGKHCNNYAKPGKKIDKQQSFQTHTQSFTLREIRSASKNFSKKIGEGGFGPVFYGKLATGQEIAIKVSSGISKQGHLEFFNEVDLLSRIHHKNLVSLIGYCQDKDRQMLIYEYLPKGSLRDHLYGPLATTPMTWNTRIRIALDAAQGLEYLHMACSPNIIHRDVKSSNILLTAKMEAKVSDFGLSKLALQEGATHISTLVKGTAGYLDPEYYISQKLTVKSDVYSFGVVLLELICGRPPINVLLNNPSQKLSITEVVRPHLQAGNLQEIVDPGLQSDYSLESMWKVIEVAMTSVEPKDSHRPNMQEVVQELREAAAIEEQRCAKLARPPRASDGQQGGRNSSSSEIRGDLFTDTSQESVGSRYSMPSPR